LESSKAGDTATVLSLMDDDVVFMVPCKEPFGKEAFSATSAHMKNVLMESTSDIVELKILGDWAWMRNHLRVIVTAPDSKPVTHQGYTLTILRKKANGNWVLARDANLLMPES